MRKQRNAAFTDEIITEQKEVSADKNNAKTDGTSGLKMKRKNSYFSGYGTENLGSCPAPFTHRDMLCNASEGRLTEAASGDGGETVPGASGAEKALTEAASGDGGETVPGASGAEKARSYAVFEALTPPEEYLEIIRFRHYTHFWRFDCKAQNGRKKRINHSIEVSVVLHLVTVN